jgi:hypothetical protein
MMGAACVVRIGDVRGVATIGEWWESLSDRKKREWVAAGVVLAAVLGALVWLGSAGWLDPLPEQPLSPPQAAERPTQMDDTAARTALGDAAIKALKGAKVTAAISAVEIYNVGEVTVTLLEASEDLGSEAQVSDVAQGVAAVIFSGAAEADTVFVHDGDGKTIGRFSR